jgi:hypothetical protein
MKFDTRDLKKAVKRESGESRLRDIYILLMDIKMYFFTYFPYFLADFGKLWYQICLANTAEQLGVSWKA